MPTVIESASRGALDDTAAAYPEIAGVLLDAHFSISARPPACRLARGSRLAAGGSMSAKELSDAWARQISWC